jgi:HEPN domain-containing protein
MPGEGLGILVLRLAKRAVGVERGFMTQWTGTLTRREFQVLGRTRLRDAQELLAARRYAGAYYLAGYAIECGLKTCIAKTTRRYAFPEKNSTQKYYIHDLDRLLEVAGLRQALPADLTTAWSVVTDWTEESRYETKTEIQARDLYQSVADILNWVETQW